MNIATEESHLAARLADQFPDQPVDGIERLVDQEFARYEDASVQAFVPILVERAVAGHLRGRKDERP